MASALYDSYKQDLLEGSIDIPTDDIKIVLVDTGTYTFSASDDFHDDLSGIVATSGNLTGKTVTGGVFDAADITLSSVSGATVEAIVIYKDTGSSATSPLIAYIDGLSVTPDGGDITVQWDSGANKIFSLG